MAALGHKTFVEILTFMRDISRNNQKIKFSFSSRIAIFLNYTYSSLEISSEHPTQFMKAVCALFQQCLPKLESLEAVESHIFAPALPVVHRFLTEVKYCFLKHGMSSKSFSNIQLDLPVNEVNIM